MVDFLLNHFTAEADNDATKRNALLVKFLDLVRCANGNELPTFDMLGGVFPPTQSGTGDTGAYSSPALQCFCSGG
jgi:hypothetical protein